MLLIKVFFIKKNFENLGKYKKGDGHVGGFSIEEGMGVKLSAHYEL